MSRKHSRSHSKHKKFSTQLARDPQIQERIDEQLIFRNQLEIAEKLLRRLAISSLNAGFINASSMFCKFSENFSSFTPGFVGAVEGKIEALESIDN